MAPKAALRRVLEELGKTNCTRTKRGSALFIRPIVLGGCARGSAAAGVACDVAGCVSRRHRPDLNRLRGVRSGMPGRLIPVQRNRATDRGTGYGLAIMTDAPVEPDKNRGMAAQIFTVVRCGLLENAGRTVRYGLHLLQARLKIWAACPIA